MVVHVSAIINANVRCAEMDRWIAEPARHANSQPYPAHGKHTALQFTEASILSARLAQRFPSLLWQ